MQRLAIYDLDRTLTRRPTFTAFLMFAAARAAPWRLLFAPAWILAMLLYRVGLYDRTTLKRFGMRVMVGRLSPENLASIGSEFADRRVAAGGLMPGAMRLVAEDRAAGARIVIATAAFEFYAIAFARHCGIEDVIATQWDGRGIPGGNCYGARKSARVRDWLGRESLARSNCEVRMVSDSFADAPLLDWADEAIFVTANRRQAAKARIRGWDSRDLSR